MKYPLYSIILISLLFSLCASKPKKEISIESIFTQDSGFIDRQELLYLFPQLDTIDFVEESELYGKYFRVNGSQNKYVALVFKPDVEEYTGTQVVMVDVQNNEIIEGDSFNYWWFYSIKDQIKNFSKIDDYYYLPLCIGHGSAYGAYGFYLFNKIDDTGSPVYENVYSGNPIPQYQMLSMGKIKIVKDTLKINYLLEEGIYEEINGENTPRTTSIGEWNVDYIRKDKEWIALDSTLFNTAEYIFM